MTCKLFDLALADYITGRLSAEQALAMKLHGDGCAACGELLQRERAVSEAFGTLRSLQADADLWPSVRAAIAAPVRVPVRRLSNLRLVLAGSMGVCAVAAAMLVSTFTPTKSAGNRPATASEVRPVVQLASELDPLPNPDQEGAFKGSEAREALFGMGR